VSLDRIAMTETRASWTTNPRWPGRFAGVVKEVGTDAWLWLCATNRPVPEDCRQGHETRKEAIACARARIEAVAREGGRG